MAIGMRKPAFYVVSSTVTILVLVGFLSLLIRPHIPTPIENDLWKEESQFLSRAATQKIDWKKPTREAFASARRRDLPILLFIGNGYDPRARALDLGSLMSPRIQALLARNFACIRVDTLEHPEYRNAVLPLSKYRVGVHPGFQLWVLDPSGRVMDHIPTLVGLFPTDENLLARELVEARDKFESIGSLRTELESAQGADFAALTGSRELVAPPFAEYNALLSQSLSSDGGFIQYGARTLTPEAWRWLLSTGQEGLFHDSIDPVLRSGVVDLIDGGFFHGSRDEKWVEIDMCKSATTNANMLLLLASASALLNDPLYRYLSERTLDSLLTEFTLTNGVAAYRPSDQAGDFRSKRASFGVRKLLEALPDRTDLEFAQTNLGMRVETNPRMTPMLAGAGILQNRVRLDSILSKLRASAGPGPECQATGYADVTGYCLARMLESARILGDAKLLESAASAFKWVELARRGDEMLHSAAPGFAGEGYAGDYLGYADAAFQFYLTTGSYAAIQSGRLVLLRCLDKFDAEGTGAMKLADDREAPFPWTKSQPEIYDTGTASAMAMAMRLAEDYGRLFPSDSVFIRFANKAAGRFGATAFSLKERGAGYFNSASRAFDDEFFVATGPNAQQLADAVAKRHPFRLCVPAFGDIREDIQRRGAGVYVVRGENISGPFSAEAAAARLSPFLGSGT